MVLGARDDNLFLLVANHQQQVSFDFLLTARNFASTLFLLGNPTFVPQRISLFSKNTPNPLDRMDLREYLGDVSTQYTDAQVVAQSTASIRIQNEQIADILSGLQK